MKPDTESGDLQNKTADLQNRISHLREKVEGLTNAATLDMIGKVEELETMSEALERDASEVSSETGAGLDTTLKLQSVIDSKLTSLEQEIEALSLGNPTTISAALDALVDLGGDK